MRSRNDVTWGWLVRGMHKWGASAMIVVVFLHLGRVFFFGSYKYPRELTWVTGALLLILTMFMGLTGYLLVWDQKAYWATVVAVNITASAPIIGPYIADILRAGPEFGPTTLSRFYSIHMLVIPGAIATFIGLHLFLITKLGIAEPPYSKRRLAVEREEDEARRAAERERLPYGRRPVPAVAPDAAPQPTRRRERLVNRGQQEYYKRDYAQAKKEGKPFFPYAVYKDLLIATLAIGIVIALAIVHRVEVGEPVNPASTDFVPRPEWYFFFLFELLKIFKGQNALMPVIMATFIIPNILMLLLIITPFIDRGPERRIQKRPIALFSGIAVIVFLAYMTNMGANSNEGVGAEGLPITGRQPDREGRRGVVPGQRLYVLPQDRGGGRTRSGAEPHQRGIEGPPAGVATRAS